MYHADKSFGNFILFLANFSFVVTYLRLSGWFDIKADYPKHDPKREAERKAERERKAYRVKLEADKAKLEAEKTKAKADYAEANAKTKAVLCQSYR